jgi:hypothetical protein
MPGSTKIAAGQLAEEQLLCPGEMHVMVIAQAAERDEAETEGDHAQSGGSHCHAHCTMAWLNIHVLSDPLER